MATKGFYGSMYPQIFFGGPYVKKIALFLVHKLRGHTLEKSANFKNRWIGITNSPWHTVLCGLVGKNNFGSLPLPVFEEIDPPTQVHTPKSYEISNKCNFFKVFCDGGARFGSTLVIWHGEPKYSCRESQKWLHRVVLGSTLPI